MVSSVRSLTRAGIVVALVLPGVAIIYSASRLSAQAPAPDAPAADSNAWTCSRCNTTLGGGKMPPSRCPGCGAFIANAPENNGAIFAVKQKAATPRGSGPGLHAAIWIVGGVLAALVVVGIIVGAIAASRTDVKNPAEEPKAE